MPAEEGKNGKKCEVTKTELHERGFVLGPTG